MKKKGNNSKVGNLLHNCRVCGSWHAEHVCSLNSTSISYNFLNKWRNVFKKNLILWKKGNNSKMGNQIYFTIAGYVDLDMLNMFAV
jgi:hypothetical protein